jgi:hypothetical protein
MAAESLRSPAGRYDAEAWDDLLDAVALAARQLPDDDNQNNA